MILISCRLCDVVMMLYLLNKFECFDELRNSYFVMK